MPKKSLIYQPDGTERPALQFPLFGNSESKKFKQNYNPYPPITHRPHAVEEILTNSPYGIGIDFEFSIKSNKATILGLASPSLAYSRRFEEEELSFIVDYAKRTGKPLIGHAVIGADKPVSEMYIGKTELNQWEDTMLLYFLLNQDLAKSPQKHEEEKGSMGFMNIWAMCSLYLSIPNWKDCPMLLGMSNACTGPCPTHDPFKYCAIDSWAPLITWDLMLKEAERMKMPLNTYHDLKELTEVATKMQDFGVSVDLEYVKKLEKESDAKKDLLFPTGSKINPRSPKQIIEYFRSCGIGLEATEKEDIRKELEKHLKRAGYDEEDKIPEKDNFTIPEFNEAQNDLYRLYLYKDAGKGLKAWFDEKYLDKEKIAHPRFNTIGASTRRWASSYPNFQNIPKVGFGKRVRGAIRARPGYRLVKADFSQLELRMCLYLAGHDVKSIKGDAFKWLVSEAKGAFKKPADHLRRNERYVAKSVSHAADYLEGIQFIDPDDLSLPKIKYAERAGALRIYRDWEHRGHLVAFNGINLAERVFGTATIDNRRLALEIQEDIYFHNFPILREWHRKVLKQIEEESLVRYANGNFLRLYSGLRDDAKIGVAALGQGNSAVFVQGVILRYNREIKHLPIIQVHDELVFEVPIKWTDEKCLDFISLMGEESKIFPDFVCPFKADVGLRWLDAYEENKDGSKTLVLEDGLRPLNY